MMRISHITFSLLNAGKENMLVDIANKQSNMGHQVAIIIINSDIDKSIINRVSKKVKVFTLKRTSGSKNIWPFVRIFFILNLSFRAQVIHSHDHFLGPLLKYITPIRTILTIHAPKFEAQPMYSFNKTIAISESVKKEIEERSKLHCKVIYNGIDTNLIRSNQNQKYTNELRIIQVKRLDHLEKGQDLLIEAVNHLLGKVNVNIHVDFVGDGNSKAYLEELVQQYNLSASIRFLGNKTREWVYTNLCNYHLFAHPSRYEGFGLSLTEAMAAKIPVLSSNIEGPAEILQEGKYGLVFTNEDVHDLTKALLKAFELYQSGEINELIENAYTHCLQHFSIEKTAQLYCETYKELINA
jgi:glycosyltransferase involved in cell wall biosynthesis